MSPPLSPPAILLLVLTAVIAVPDVTAQHSVDVPANRVAPAALVMNRPEPLDAFGSSVDLAAEVSEVYWTAVESRVADALARGNHDARIWAMKRIIVESSRTEAAGRFRQSIPHLLSLFESDRDPSVRLMAVSSLHGLQDEASMEMLNQMVDTERDWRVRRTALRVLSEFFGKRYAERQEDRTH